MADIDNLIDEYAEHKMTLDEYTKQVNSENTRIKSILSDMSTDTYLTSKYKAVVSTQERESIREEDLLNYLRTQSIPDGIIKKKDYIDFEALESALYHNQLSYDIVKEMSNYKDVKVVKTLRISKRKAGEEDE